MKKTYSTPEIQTVLFSAPVVMQSQSKLHGGEDSGSGITDSKEWQGGFLWDDTNEE